MHAGARPKPEHANVGEELGVVCRLLAFWEGWGWLSVRVKSPRSSIFPISFRPRVRAPRAALKTMADHAAPDTAGRPVFTELPLDMLEAVARCARERRPFAAHKPCGV